MSSYPWVEDGTGDRNPQEISGFPHAIKFPFQKLLDFLVQVIGAGEVLAQFCRLHGSMEAHQGE